MAELNINKLSKQVTLVITFHETRQWKWRKALAALLIKLAAKILGCGIRFDGVK